MTTFNNVPFSEDALIRGKPVDIAVMGVPFDLGASTSGGGMAAAPTVIRNSYVADVNYRGVSVVDVGDLRLTERSARGACVDVAVTVDALYSLGVGTVIVLGGDDSINYGVLKGMGKPMPVVHLDAHDDCGTDEDLEDPLDHASWAGLTAEEGSGTPFVQYGVRTPYHNEHELVRTVNDLYDVHEIVKGSEEVVVCIDMDVVDPAYAPGVGTSEPGGITSNMLLEFCYFLGWSGHVKVLSFTEVCPAKDLNDMTSRLVFRCILNYISGYADRTR